RIKRKDRGHDLFLSQLLHHLTEFRLEDHDYRSDQSAGQIGDDPEDRVHFENICDQQKGTYDQKALEHRIGAGILNPHHELIYEKGYQYDLYNINYIDRRHIDMGKISVQYICNVQHGCSSPYTESAGYRSFRDSSSFFSKST